MRNITIMIPLIFACQPIPGASMFLPAVTTALYIFIPIVIIEAILIKNLLKKSFGQSFKFCIIANLSSLLAGLLFAFVLAFSIAGLFSLSEAIAAIICLLSWVAVPAILIWVENAVYKKCWKNISKKALFKAVITVNVITYVIFLISANYMKERTHRERWKKNYRMSCSSNLKQIGISLQQYAMDYNGFFPDKELDQLRTADYLTDYGVYVCPGSLTQRGEANQKLTEKNLDYIYQSGLKFNAKDAKTPLAWDKPKKHEYYGDYGNVLFINGQVKGFVGKDWMEQAGIKKREKQVDKTIATEKQKAAKSFKNKDYSTAESHLKTIVKLKPDFPECWAGLGMCLARQEKNDEAKRAFENALSIHQKRYQQSPDDWNQLFQQAMVLLFLNRKSEANKILKIGIKKFPTQSEFKVPIKELSVFHPFLDKKNYNKSTIDRSDSADAKYQKLYYDYRVLVTKAIKSKNEANLRKITDEYISKTENNIFLITVSQLDSSGKWNVLMHKTDPNIRIMLPNVHYAFSDKVHVHKGKGYVLCESNKTLNRIYKDNIYIKMAIKR